MTGHQQLLISALKTQDPCREIAQCEAGSIWVTCRRWTAAFSTEAALLWYKQVIIGPEKGARESKKSKQDENYIEENLDLSFLSVREDGG